jgi:hypothetical protein
MEEKERPDRLDENDQGATNVSFRNHAGLVTPQSMSSISQKQES